MATTNYKFEKRQRDLAKKKKQDEKRQKKLDKKQHDGVTEVNSDMESTTQSPNENA